MWVEGAGPPLVMVHGSIADHTTFEPFVAVLRNDVTTFAMDRRGFGASGDRPDYAIDRDFEDVAAVVDAVAARTGGPVALWGHSYGANCAMGGAARSANVGHLVLYEPSLGIPYPPGSIEAHRGRARPEGTTTRPSPRCWSTSSRSARRRWTGSAPARCGRPVSPPPPPSRESAAPRRTGCTQPGQFAGVTAPTLFLMGSDSVAVVKDATALAAAAISGSQVRVLDGHEHFAHRTDPEMVAEIIRQFIA